MLSLGSLGTLYHVVYSNNFRTVNILNADHEVEESFALLENQA